MPKLFVFDSTKQDMILKYGKFEFRLYNNYTKCYNDICGDTILVIMKMTSLPFPPTKYELIFSDVEFDDNYFNSITSMIGKLTKKYDQEFPNDPLVNDFILIAALLISM